MIHIVKGFGIVNKAEVDVFLEFPCFLYDPTIIGNSITGSSDFLNSACTSGNSLLSRAKSLCQRILSINLLAWEINAIVQ